MCVFSIYGGGCGVFTWCQAMGLSRAALHEGSLRGPIPVEYGLVPNVESHTIPVTPRFLGYGNLERHSTLLRLRVGAERRAPHHLSRGTG